MPHKDVGLSVRQCSAEWIPKSRSEVRELRGGRLAAPRGAEVGEVLEELEKGSLRPGMSTWTSSTVHFRKTLSTAGYFLPGSAFSSSVTHPTHPEHRHRNGEWRQNQGASAIVGTNSESPSQPRKLEASRSLSVISVVFHWIACADPTTASDRGLGTSRLRPSS